MLYRDAFTVQLTNPSVELAIVSIPIAPLSGHRPGTSAKCMTEIAVRKRMVMRDPFAKPTLESKAFS